MRAHRGLLSRSCSHIRCDTWRSLAPQHRAGHDGHFGVELANTFDVCATLRAMPCIAHMRSWAARMYTTSRLCHDWLAESVSHSV